MVLMAVSAFGCGGGAGDVTGPLFRCGLFCVPPLPSGPPNVRLHNDAPQLAAHLFAPNEAFPCCRVEPGSSRTVELPGLVIDSTVEFRAEAGGQVIASVICKLTSAGFNAPQVLVTFSVPAQLTCHGW
jgi:hypothetical protein